MQSQTLILGDSQNILKFYEILTFYNCAFQQVFLWVLLLFVCFTFPLVLLVSDLELFLKIHFWMLFLKTILSYNWFGLEIAS